MGKTSEAGRGSISDPGSRPDHSRPKLLLGGGKKQGAREEGLPLMTVRVSGLPFPAGPQEAATGRLTSPTPGLGKWAGSRNRKPWILGKAEEGPWG